MTPKRKRYISISRLFPNMITVGALCCGLSSVRFAMMERWDMAVTFIVIAAILDALDGTIARLLNASSKFGAELDSLSDIVSFGVAPALVMYMWILSDMKRFGWAASLVFVICCALRLARFNAMLQEEEETDEAPKGKNFTGVPAPAGALLALFPLVFTFEYQPIFTNVPHLCAIYLLAVGGMMVSRIPTFSLKNIRITHGMALPVMILATVTVVLTIIEPWHILMFVGTAYLLSIPYMFYLEKQRG